MGTIRHQAKVRYKRLIFNLFANQSPLIRFFYTHLYRSQKDGISGFTDRFSKQNPNISVIQIGANDGFHHDPIFKFIFRDGWKGILLEPQPKVFKTLSKLHALNPNITPVNAAIDYSDSQRMLYSLAVNERWAHGRASFSKEIVTEAISNGFLEKKATKEGIQLPENRSEWIEESLIDCLSPSTLMSRYDIKQIDWLQIDTEGYDFEVIKMFDIAKYSPKVISYEHSHLTDSDMTLCDEHLQSNGYEIHRFGGNTIAKKES